MGPADVAEAMAEVGCSADQIARTLRILKTRPSSSALRQARYRKRKAESDACDVTLRTVTSLSLPKKERVPPTPPLQEKTPSLFSPSLRSGLVDEPVDAPPPSKKIERTDSDQKLLDQITDVWNAWAIARHLPQVKFLTDERARRCRSRLRDIANGEEPVPAFRKVLSKCETSFFIRGSPRSPLTFDHLMREGFLSKMLEGGFEYEGKDPWRK